ncbi:CoA ester lyase [Rhodococcus sp. USK10]|uniref:HpcH/HpaI aldolase/citrate lyase family protein n=1 Tax=Rhodococcus sp. USK10 TaxID=2789739 RepID=UPI001C5E547B|nr:CoA ester lyase [Rhodococcus sp. USK10]QYB02665.1 CoA ester lyase [Rhodococcus sp. USK10]
MARSYLFVPGHKEKLLGKVFDAGADAVILDLEDAVPPESKDAARVCVADALTTHPAWVRINAVGTAPAADDLAAVADRAHGIRIPKVDSVDDVRWVRDRAPGTPLICAIETGRGVTNALAIAAEPGVEHLALGGIDLRKDLDIGDGDTPLQYVRSHLVIASRAAGIAPPIDSVYPHLRDTDGLAREAAHARSLGFGGKSAIHPSQLPIIHTAFSPSEDELAWARRVVDVFEESGGAAVQLPDGEFVDLPVAERARRILQFQ